MILEPKKIKSLEAIFPWLSQNLLLYNPCYLHSLYSTFIPILLEIFWHSWLAQLYQGLKNLSLVQIWDLHSGSLPKSKNNYKNPTPTPMGVAVYTPGNFPSSTKICRFYVLCFIKETHFEKQDDLFSLWVSLYATIIWLDTNSTRK